MSLHPLKSYHHRSSLKPGSNIPYFCTKYYINGTGLQITHIMFFFLPINARRLWFVCTALDCFGETNIMAKQRRRWKFDLCAFCVFRWMASGRSLVQRVRHVRRAGVQFQYYAHVLHIVGKIPGHKTST